MIEYPFKMKPYQHQYNCWDLSRDRKEFALLLDMGTGKTKILIDTLAWLYDQGLINGALIVAPKGVYLNWVYDEIPKHIPDHIDYEMVHWSSYKTKEIMTRYNKFMKESHKLKILVMNVEAMITDGARTMAHRFLNYFSVLMAIDESTTIKNLGAQRTKKIIELGRYAKYRRILSGRPVTRSPIDLFSQCLFLNKSLLGFQSEYSFRNRYAIVQKMQLGNRVFNKIVGYQRLEELTDKLKDFSFHITKEECLDLPEKVYMYREVDLTDEQKKIYNEMKHLSLAQLSAFEVVTVTMAMTKIQKLHEIVCGFLRNQETGIITPIPNNRMGALLDIIEETDDKMIIWSNNTYDIELITKTLGEKYGKESVGAFYGGTSDEERQSIKERFQDPNDSLRFFVGNPATGKFGITLTEAKVVVYYSNSYDLEFRIQSEDRAHRIGQHNTVTIIDIVARKTVDEHIIKLLRNKKQLSEVVMGDDIKAWLE
jgi:SNF2 family DNA or RNA helicase